MKTPSPSILSQVVKLCKMALSPDQLSLVLMSSAVADPMTSLMLLSHFQNVNAEQAPEEHPITKRNRKRRERCARLSKEQRRRGMRKVPRIAMPLPHRSPWANLHLSDNVEGFTTVTGHDPPNFRSVLQAFEPVFLSHTPHVGADGNMGPLRHTVGRKRRGRPRSATPDACLGVALFWTRTACANWTTAQCFGLTGSPCELWWPSAVASAARLQSSLAGQGAHLGPLPSVLPFAQLPFRRCFFPGARTDPVFLLGM